MRLWLAAVLAALVFSLAWPAWADTDYRCLNTCLTAGGGNGCLHQCSYGQTTAPVAHKTATNVHKQFDPIVPTGGDTVLAPHHVKPPAPSKDYHCVAQCLQAGGQYNLCNENCTKRGCGAGGITCKDLTGALPAPAFANGQQAAPAGGVAPLAAVPTITPSPTPN
jgi:hypothetical protein